MALLERLYLGGTEISKAYLGATLVFDVTATDITPDAFTLGGPYTVDPGEVFTLPTVPVSGIDAGKSISAELYGGTMDVLADQGTTVATGVTTAQVGRGYQIIITPDVPDTHGTDAPVTLDLGTDNDEGVGNIVSATAEISTRALTTVQSGAFVALENADGGDIEYDYDADGTTDGVITEAEQAGLVGQAPHFDIAPSYTENGDNLEIFIGYPVWDGANPRYLIQVIADDGTTVLRSWDTDADWNDPDPGTLLQYNKSGDGGVLTIRWWAVDDNDPAGTEVTDQFDTLAAPPDEWSVMFGSEQATVTSAPPASSPTLTNITEGDGQLIAS